MSNLIKMGNLIQNVIGSINLNSQKNPMVRPLMRLDCELYEIIFNVWKVIVEFNIFCEIFGLVQIKNWFFH